MANAVVASWTACINELQQAVGAPCVELSDSSALLRHVYQLEEQPPLPHAAWKRLVQDVQVTAKLAALCVHTLQQPDAPRSCRVLTCTALNAWLGTAVASMGASPGSRAAAAVRQQLQDSQLLQHLGPAMDAAAARLTDAVTALVTTASVLSSSTDSSAVPSTTQQDSIQQQKSRVEEADVYCALLLQVYQQACCAASQNMGFCITAALPAAPAAVRMILTGFQACSKLQQLVQVPLQCGSFAAVGGSFVSRSSCLGFQMVSVLTGAVKDDMLQTCPAARELLSSPDLVSCLAIVVITTALGLDTSGAVGGSATPSPANSSSSGSDPGSSTRCQLPGTEGRQRQQQARQGSSVGCDSGGSSGSSGICCSSGVQPDSLTPLSCSLFDVLGFSQRTAKEAAKVLKADGLTTVAYLHTVGSDYYRVVKYQVDQARFKVYAAAIMLQKNTSKLCCLALLPPCARADQAQHAFSAQLLLQLETNLLLGLAVLQLAASIPDSCPGAQAARDLACLLASCVPLQTLWSAAGLHKLPRPAAYTGPQLALQLLPSPYGQQQPAPNPSQQRRRHKHHLRRLPAEWCVLAPTAPLLAELLPLLTRHCLTQLQKHQEQLQQQQPAALRTGQQRSAVLLAVRPCLMALFTLLLSSVVPAIGAEAAAEGSPAAAAATAAAAAGHHDGRVSYKCVLHAQDVLMAHACKIFSTFEGAMRCEAALCDAATPAAAIGTGDAAVAAAAAASTSASSAAVQADDPCFDGRLQGYSIVFSGLCFHYTVSGDYPHYFSPLVLLTLAAGPGSQVQRQLHSLLATVVKLSGLGVLGNDTQLEYRASVASVALALLNHDQQQQQQQLAGPAAEGCSSGNDAAVAMLPCVVILGRCFLLWAGELREGASLSQEQQQQQQQGCGSVAPCDEEDHDFDFVELVPALQQWLQTGSTCDQLTAAGYAPMPLLQQLEQLASTCQSLQDSPSDTAAVLAAAQQLQSTGLALCSFAVPCMCNNPGCTSMAGLSELAAVSGHSCICAGCRVARYCGRACQRAAWKQHKPVCGALRAAASTAGGEGAWAVAGKS